MKRKLTAVLLTVLLLVSLVPSQATAADWRTGLYGVWQGSYTGVGENGLTQRALRLCVTSVYETYFKGIASIDGGANGAYVFEGDYTGEGEIRFCGTNWIFNPSGFSCFPFRASVNGGTISGSIDGESDRPLTLTKVSDAPDWRPADYARFPADWSGTYGRLSNNVRSESKLTLHIDGFGWREFTGTASIFDNGAYVASYTLHGLLNHETGTIEMQGTKYIDAPENNDWGFVYFAGWVDMNGTPHIHGGTDFGIWEMTASGSATVPYDGEILALPDFDDPEAPAATETPTPTETPENDDGEGKEKNEDGKPGGKADGSKDGSGDKDTHCKNPSDHDTYCVDPCLLTSTVSGFTLGRDNNAFYHTNQAIDGAGFTGCTDYRLDDAYFQRLTEHSGAGEKNKVRRDMLRPWQGACYGVSLSMGVRYIGYNMPQFLWSGLAGDSYFTLPKPSERSEFLNLVNFLQLSQSLRGSGKRALHAAECRSDALMSEGVSEEHYGGLPDFLAQVIRVCSPGKVGFLSYFTRSGGHTVLVTGSSFDEAAGVYHVELYDLNAVRPGSPVGSFIDMTVSGDCTSFRFTDANGKTVDSDNYLNLLLEGPDDMAMLCMEYDNRYYYPRTRVSFDAEDSFRMEDAAGRVLDYDGERFQGDLPIKEFSTVDYGDGGRISIVIEETDVLKLTAIGPSLDFDAYNDDDYKALSGTGIESAELHLDGGGLSLRGDEYEFEAWVSTAPNAAQDSRLLKLRGAAAGETVIRPKDETLAVRCDACVTDAETAAVTGTDVVESALAQPLAAFTVGPDAVITPETVSGFTDVGPEAGYAEAVRWAAEKGITNGTTPTTFSPLDTVTRGQAVTFLWRSLGCPEPVDAGAAAMFTDLTETYYQKAVAWAVENGVTKGISDTLFGPELTLSTAHIVTFLYRTVNPGLDGWYAEAGSWAKTRGLMDGVETQVNDVTNCPRAIVVMLLYRLLG